MNKQSALQIFLCIFVLLVFSFSTVSKGMAKGDAYMLKNISSYKIYYDSPTPHILQQMKKYDLVIIEPTLYSIDQITTIKQAGTIVFGYINTMEADNWNTSFVQKLDKSDYYYKNGKKVYLEQWDAHLMNLTSSHYQSLLQNEIKEQVVSKKLDGVFFDTVGDIDDYFMNQPAELKAQRDGLVSLMKQVKTQYPNLSFIQNWGFDTLKVATLPYVDGVMWESFHKNIVKNDQWSQDRIQDLNKLQRKKDIAILTVSSKQHQSSSKYAASKGFLHYQAKKDYNSW
ncbi:endo alpha-1,4 polygalactosaminidase [Fictibacillus nanhaiensis]|uniref:putative glycoside hydrolase n=1 Tax=Fictibacillus nanhaiensis TaxID=742169 RepID=UPI001C984278|nr:putative glycoside hydrolase [Fictibacillus nanhaiensis]MBY6036660.1 endo alpha-1,4 polygalactosaminidase [Fictibacillus nanhaiensis]